MAQSTTLFDAHDRPVFTIYKEQRIEVPLNRISPHLVRALVSMEDQRFYEHRGVDTVRVFGAMLANLRQGRRAQGGSTITQQLARQSFLTADKTFARKFKEIVRRSSARAHLLEAGDSRALLQQGVLRRWAVRCRSGIARILREARGRSFDRPGGAARRPREVAVHATRPP